MTASNKILVITGPTASGKSGVAVDVAVSLDRKGEIVYADSAAVYRRLDIGTAKPTVEEKGGIPHHLIDVCDVDEDFDAEKYSKMAAAVVEKIVKRGNIPIVTGGTGLYIKALIHGLFSIPADAGQARKRLLEELEEKGLNSLYSELKAVDQKSAGVIDKNDKTRIIRALEIFRITGKAASEIREKHAFKKKAFDPLYIGLTMERSFLYERIDLRVEEMIESGIVDEVRALLGEGYLSSCRSLNTIGYKEIVRHTNGEIDLERATHLIKQNTRRLAKRQITWFKNVENINWFEYPYDIRGIVRKTRESLNV